MVEGWLILRKLAKGNDVGLTVRGERWKDYRFGFQFVIRRNPGPVSALALAIGFPDNEQAASVTRMSVTFTCADLRKALIVLNGGGGKGRGYFKEAADPCRQPRCAILVVTRFVAADGISSYVISLSIEENAGN
ncbi:hypothetical protein J4772_31670 [Cohnella sp. LGH]|uniref:hypothetical protein n=1 Tax=Cohnella sp. LGH TaxID=1619153 RepID=UPI001AD9745D|nr:hypothetical protein [Cohnella sp. LGH]QTH42021.1 hypothetical protein J4772_31670 [Cohnella sp. LGH]